MARLAPWAKVLVITAVAHRVVLAAGWPRRIIAFASGACGALAMAPVDVFPAMILAMTVAVWLIDGSDRVVTDAKGRRRHFWPSLRSAAAAGWFWGFGYFVAGLWWLGAAFLVEADRFAWALPLGVLALPAYLAIWPALGFALARVLWLSGWGRVLVLALGLGIAEALRGVALSGFPWNEFGMALGDHLVLAQSASLIGLHGLTLLTVVICALPSTLLSEFGVLKASATLGRRVKPTICAAVILLLVAAFGLWRLDLPGAGSVDGIKLRIVQPNIGQGEDFNYSNRKAILQNYLTLSDKATSATRSGLSDVTHLIWPESAFPFILSRDPEALAAIGAALPPATTLITGAARAETTPDNARPPQYFNSIQVIDHDGVVLDTYDKVHLVPFGEYLPFAAVLRWIGLQQFVHIPGGFESGSIRHLLNIPGWAPAVPAICYEAIFSGALMGGIPSDLRPGLILNLTNDSWFGKTFGPYQHLAQARLRAIEQGLPLIRAATSGISAIIDPYGRMTGSLPLEVADVLDGFLPKPIGPTVFFRFGAFILVGMYVLLLTAVLGMRYREERKLSFDGP